MERWCWWWCGGADSGGGNDCAAADGGDVAAGGGGFRGSRGVEVVVTVMVVSALWEI